MKYLKKNLARGAISPILVDESQVFELVGQNFAKEVGPRPPHTPIIHELASLVPRLL